MTVEVLTQRAPEKREGRLMRFLRTAWHRKLTENDMMCAAVAPNWEPSEIISTNGIPEIRYSSTEEGPLVERIAFHNATPRSSCPDFPAEPKFELEKHEFQYYTPEGELRARRVFSDLHFLFRPTGRITVREYVYDPPGRLWGKKLRSFTVGKT